MPPLPRRSALSSCPSGELPLVLPYPTRSTVHATPTYHLDTLPTTKRNCAALRRLEPTSPRLSLFPSNPWWCFDGQELQLRHIGHRGRGKARGGSGHLLLAYTHRSGLDVTKWQGYVVGISGKIVWGWLTWTRVDTRENKIVNQWNFDQRPASFYVAAFRS